MNSLKEYEKAVEFYNRSLEIKNKLYGQDCIESAMCHFNLGQVYSEMTSKVKEASECFKKSLAIWQKHMSESVVAHIIGCLIGLAFLKLQLGEH